MKEKGLEQLAEFTRISKYARYLPEKERRETYQEQINRMMNMHRNHLGDKFESVKEEWEFAKKLLLQKRILGSQRALQFGGDAVLQQNMRIYNCAFTHADRVRVFQDIMYVCLCGTGMGYSVQKHHVDKLPTLDLNRKDEILEYEVRDSIEGWADAIGVLVNSYFESGSEVQGHPIVFDYTKVRPAGALIKSSGSKAPGPDGLKRTIDAIDNLFKEAVRQGQHKLRPIQVHDIICHIADSVVSGGVRRAALISLFSKDDDEMIKAKTDDWFISQPQRGRANNSVVLVRDETTKEEFSEIMKSVKMYGEPGFVFMSDTETGLNPCLDGDMLVTTDKGEVPIRDICQNPKEYQALSVDEKGDISFKDITYGIKTKENTDVIRLDFDDGTYLNLTPDHRVMTNNRGYVMASDLNEDDEIVSTDCDVSQIVETVDVTPSGYVDQKEWVNRVIVDNK